MVGSNGTMMAIRVVRSKLRKREEHSNSVHPEAPQTITAVVPPAEPVAYRQQPIWVFPPNPPQPFLYSSNQVNDKKNSHYFWHFLTILINSHKVCVIFIILNFATKKQLLLLSVKVPNSLLDRFFNSCCSKISFN